MHSIKALYTATATATGGRDGRAVSSDGFLDVKLTTPRELGGADGEATNPEQLFAAGYSACFLGALKFVAARQKVALPADTAITCAMSSHSRQTRDGRLLFTMWFSPSTLPGCAPAARRH